MGLESKNTDMVLFGRLEGARLDLPFPNVKNVPSALGDGKPPRYKHVAFA